MYFCSIMTNEANNNIPHYLLFSTYQTYRLQTLYQCSLIEIFSNDIKHMYFFLFKLKYVTNLSKKDPIYLWFLSQRKSLFKLHCFLIVSESEKQRRQEETFHYININLVTTALHCNILQQLPFHFSELPSFIGVI